MGAGMEAELDQARALIAKAGMQSFRPLSSAYAATANALFPFAKIELSNIEPIVRGAHIHTFVSERAMAILSAIENGDALPAVLVYGWSTGRWEYKLYDGFHRYYLLIALGFTETWVGVNPCPREITL